MSNIDKQALREAAEKATSGPWKAFSDVGTGTYAIHTPRDKRCENIIKWAGFDCQKNAKANAEFIAAFNPKVAKALLDELEASEHTAAVDHEAACSLVEENEELKRKLEAAEKRIADYHRALNNIASVARRYLPDYDEHPDIQAADDLLESAAGIGKGE